MKSYLNGTRLRVIPKLGIFAKEIKLKLRPLNVALEETTDDNIEEQIKNEHILKKDLRRKDKCCKSWRN